MNTLQLMNRSNAAIAVAAGAALLLLTSGTTLAQGNSGTSATAHAGGKMRIISSSSTSDASGGKGDNQSVEIHVDNGKVAVKVNGQEIPAAQIHEENGNIIITDASGNQLSGVELKLQHGGNDAWVFSSAGSGNTVWDAASAGGAAIQVTQPKVMIGVHMAEPGEALEAQLGLEPGKTTMISGLYEGLPAHAAGLAQYDIIVKVDGKSPADSETVRAALADKSAGDEVKLSVIHGGKSKEVTVRLAAYDSAAMEKATLIGTGPDEQAWSTALPGGWGSISLKGSKLPDEMLRQLVIAAPKVDLKPYLRDLGPKISGQIHDATAPGGPVDQQLDKLDKRMAELEALLQKMVEQHTKNP